MSYPISIYNYFSFKNKLTRCQRLTPIVLATQEAEIRRIVVEPVQANSSQDPISKKHITKKSWWSGSRCRL
jgi:hypothetical protein